MIISKPIRIRSAATAWLLSGGLAVTGAVAVSATALASPTPDTASPSPVTVMAGPAVMHPGGTVHVKTWHLVPGAPAPVTLGGKSKTVTVPAQGPLAVSVQVPWKITPRRNTVRVDQGSRWGKTTIDVRVDWRSAGRDTTTHSGTNPWERSLTAASVKTLSARWHTDLPQHDDLSDEVYALGTYGDRLYTCNGKAEISRLDARTGTVIWQSGLDAPDNRGGCRKNTGIYDDGTGHVWVGGARLDAETGKAAEPRGFSDLTGAPSIYRNLLIAGGDWYDCTNAGAADLSTGKVAWTFPEACGNVVAGDTAVFNTTYSVVGVDAATGKARWTWHGYQPDGNLGTIGANATTILVAGPGPTGRDDDWRLTALDPTRGAVKWSVLEPYVNLGEYTVSADTVYYAGRAGDTPAQLVARDLETGTERWHAPLDYGFTAQSRSVLANGLLYVPGDRVQLINATTGTPVTSIKHAEETGGAVSVSHGIGVANGHVYIGSTKGVHDFADLDVP